MRTLLLIYATLATLTSTQESPSICPTPRGSCTDREAAKPADVPTKTRPSLHATLHSEPQHVGQVQGDAMFTWVRDALVYLCPEKQDKCSEDVRSYEGVEYTRSCREMGTNSRIGIVVRESFFADAGERCKGLREAMINIVAGAYQAQTLEAKNCYYSPWENGTQRRWCNVGGTIEVRLEDALASLVVRVYWDGDTTEGNFDCVAVAEAVRGAMKNYGVGIKNALDVLEPDTQDVRCV